MEDKIKKEFDIKLATRRAGLSSAAYNSTKIFPHSLRSLGMVDDRTGKQGWLFELLENENSQVYVIWSHKEKDIKIISINLRHLFVFLSMQDLCGQLSWLINKFLCQQQELFQYLIELNR